MKNVVEGLKLKEGLILGVPITEMEVKEAEMALELRFSEEYREYLRNFGFVCVDGHEYTGICRAKRLAVVDVTKQEWNNNKCISRKLYVIEQANIDGIVIWQSDSGEIYQSQPNREPVKICNSMCEYIEMF